MRISSGYIPTLDGWRAASIALVIMGHASPRLPGPWSQIGEIGSGYAVDLFFALSGFLICTRLLAEEARSGTISLRGFYIRRIFRLQPAAYAYLGTLCVLALFSVISIDWSDTAAAAFAVRNLIGKYGSTSWYSAHFWSLSAEEHFYLLFPALLLLVRRGRLYVWAALTLLLDAWTILAHRIGIFQFRRTDLVVSAMTVGVVAALLLKRPNIHAAIRRLLHPITALIITAVTCDFVLHHNASYSHALLQLLLPLLFIPTSLRPESFVGRVLEWQPLRFVGRMSYSLYLWQQLFFRSIYTPAAGHRVNGWICLAATCATASASYFFIEKPSIRFGHRIALRYTKIPEAAVRPESGTGTA